MAKELSLSVVTPASVVVHAGIVITHTDLQGFTAGGRHVAKQLAWNDPLRIERDAGHQNG